MKMSPRACSSKGRTGIPGRNISSGGRKYDLKICPEAKSIRPKMTIRPLDEQSPNAILNGTSLPKGTLKSIDETPDLAWRLFCAWS